MPVYKKKKNHTPFSCVSCFDPVALENYSHQVPIFPLNCLVSWQFSLFSRYYDGLIFLCTLSVRGSTSTNGRYCSACELVDVSIRQFCILHLSNTATIRSNSSMAVTWEVGMHAVH
jgi:hypothetical protein